MQRLKKGDTVHVISGRDKGRRGKILRVLFDEGKVVVEGIQIAKRHQRRTREFQGGIIEKPLPLFESKVMPVCPHCGKPARVRFGIGGDGERHRTCGACDKVLDKR